MASASARSCWRSVAELWFKALWRAPCPKRPPVASTSIELRRNFVYPGHVQIDDSPPNGEFMTKHEANPAAERKIEESAEDLGRVVGRAQPRAEDWLAQKQRMTEQLVDIRDTATGLLRQLAKDTAASARRRGRPLGSGRKSVGNSRRGPGRPESSGRKCRTMSHEACKASLTLRSSVGRRRGKARRVSS